MKKLIVITVLILFTGFTFGQTLQKGNLIGMHVLTINLDPDITMNQYLKAFSNKVIPEIEKNAPGWELFLVKGIRGENENSFGLIYVIESEDVRNKYNNDDSSPTELGISLRKKMQPFMDELNQLGTWTTEYTDWLVQ